MMMFAPRTLFPMGMREEFGMKMYSLADINPHTRPFHLTMNEFGRLCTIYEEFCRQDPRLYKYNPRARKIPQFEEIDGYNGNVPPEHREIISFLFVFFFLLLLFVRFMFGVGGSVSLVTSKSVCGDFGVMAGARNSCHTFWLNLHLHGLEAHHRVVGAEDRAGKEQSE
uniref:Uncharacterized protein n=1 Tax=Timema genevievae TaxID=629358 RepID=A0A7R9JR36_TIMGE|nr:unnamed protein product [Timema genevievae]